MAKIILIYRCQFAKSCKMSYTYTIQKILKGSKMARYLTVFITATIIMLFAAGCVENTAEQVKTEENEPVIAIRDDIKATISISKKPETKPNPTAALYKKYAVLLNEFVDDEGMVDYNSLRRNRDNIKDILNLYAKFDPNKFNAMTKKDKIAFWLNAYNIQMLNVITRNYPIESTRIMRIIWPPTSIRHIDGIWQTRFIVMDEEFTLNEVEQRFFGKEFNEPRVFLALTHASRSSPPLNSEPYYGEKLYRQLDDQAKKFLSGEKAFRIDKDKASVALSAIFQPTWHGKYFTDKYGTDKKFKSYEPVQRAVLNFVSGYIPQGDVNYLELESYEVKFIRYDWRLNDHSATN